MYLMTALFTIILTFLAFMLLNLLLNLVPLFCIFIGQKEPELMGSI